MRIRPCIDIHNGKVKQIVGGTLKDSGRESAGTAQENFVADKNADYFASIYREKGLSGGHIILLNPVREAEAYQADLAQAHAALAAFPGGMQIGGGITPAGAGKFREGVLSEAALAEMIRAVGTKRLVLDLSCRRREDGSYAVVTDRWQKFTDLVICDETLSRLSSRCDEFLIHAADVEGKRSGIERELVSILGSWQRKSGFPVTYAGGVHSLRDIDLVRNLSGGKMDVTAGSALDLFGGDLSLDDLVRAAAQGSDSFSK